jgi:phosphate transport system substrate-binding protein
MNKSLLLLVLVVLGAVVYFCVPKSHASTRYLVTGASTIAPILQKVAERLEARDPSLRIEVESGGTGRGIKDAKEGQNDLGMASRDLTAEERVGLNPVPIAHDGVALIVHGSNPVDELTRSQVVAIYTGEITDWSEVGGPAGDISVVNKAEGRSTLEVFLDHFELEASDVKADVVIGDNAQGVRLVSIDPRALGYVSIGDAQRAAESGVPVKMLRYRGVAPSVASVSDGSYPIRRSLYLLFRGEPDAVGQAILDHLASSEGRRLVQALSFVPLDPAVPGRAAEPGSAAQ